LLSSTCLVVSDEDGEVNDGTERERERERERAVTDNEEHLDNDVADDGAALTEAVNSERDEGCVERHCDGDVERTQQQQPVPADLEDAVVQQDELRLTLFLHFVLGDVVSRQVLYL